MWMTLFSWPQPKLLLNNRKDWYCFCCVPPLRQTNWATTTASVHIAIIDQLISHSPLACSAIWLAQNKYINKVGEILLASSHTQLKEMYCLPVPSLVSGWYCYFSHLHLQALWMKAPTYIHLVCITFCSIFSYSSLRVKNFLANFPTGVIISWWFSLCGGKRETMGIC